MGPTTQPAPGGQISAENVTVARSSEIPESNVRRALETLGTRITAAVTSIAAVQYAADIAYALAQVARGEARKARLAARLADDRAETARNLALQTTGQAHKARRAARAADDRAESARNLALQAAAAAREARRRTRSDQIALTAAVFN